jgi:hypothetical protein
MKRHLVVYCAPVGGSRYCDAMRRFHASYVAHDAGVEHDLLVVLKTDAGMHGPALQACSALLEVAGAVVVHPNDTLDCGTYVSVAASESDAPRYDFYTFVSTSFEVRCDGWLALMADAMRGTGRALVGVSGSHERGVAGGALNPHIRTECFTVAAPFLPAMAECPVRDRAACHQFEHGRRSLTVRCAERAATGAGPATVLRDGTVLEWWQWGEGRGWRQGEHEDLLGWDHRGREYAEAGPAHRSWLAGLTFPAPAAAETRECFTRLRPGAGAS